MKQLWKCDHCETTGDKDTVKQHETGCIFNIKNKACGTCKHRKYDHYANGDWAHYCYLYLSEKIGEQGKCPQWNK